MSQFDYQEFYEKHLPHFQPPEATLFVTFRLAGSIPQPVLRQWKAEKLWLEEEEKRLAKLRASGDSAALAAQEIRQREFQRRWFSRFEDVLHQQAHGPRWLAEEAVAEIVAEALHYRDGKVFWLDAYCLMSNHVHAVFAPLLSEAEARRLAEAGGEQNERNDAVLAVLMHSLKGYTARRANQALGRNGQFWEHESYDHVIRTGKYDRVVAYVLNNPVKAGLVEDWQDWKWSWWRCTANC